MNQEPAIAILDELFKSVGECPCPEVARRLVGLRATPEVQSRLDELADKCSDGTLSADDRKEYESYLRAVNFIGVLQAKARALLASKAAS